MNLRKHGLRAFLLAIALSLALTTVALAHLYSGQKWATSTIMWYIGGGPEGVPADWYSQYRASANTWINAPGSFALSETSPSYAQGNFGARHFSWDPNIPDGPQGITFTYSNGGTIYAASSYLNLDYGWVTNGSGMPDVRTVAIHEFGHWVRFVDSCALPASVMCAEWQVKWSLTGDDKSDLASVYP